MRFRREQLRRRVADENVSARRSVKHRASIRSRRRVFARLLGVLNTWSSNNGHIQRESTRRVMFSWVAKYRL